MKGKVMLLSDAVSMVNASAEGAAAFVARAKGGA